MLRLLVALDLPDAVRRRLGAIAHPVSRARWVEPENMHLTLRFVGEIDESHAADLDAALSQVSAPAFELALKGVGHFGVRDRVRVLWVGVEKQPALMELQQRIDQAARRAGLPPEGRRFHAHVTLARLRETPLDGVAPFLAGEAAYMSPAFAATRFTLYSSWRGNDGPAYVAERSYPLAGGEVLEAADDADWSAP